MPIAPNITLDVIGRLRVIQGLCVDIATRLEDEASVQTIPRNYEYDGRRTAMLDIADEIGKTMGTLEGISDSEKISEQVQVLFTWVEARKKQNSEEQERNREYQHNFRLNGLYYTPRGASAGCEKALEWLHEALKSVGISPKAPTQTQPEDSVNPG